VPISASDAISPAYQRTKQQLTHPFRFGQWVRLAFVGVLAGESSFGGGGGNSGVSVPSTNHQHGSQQFLPTILPQQLANHPGITIGLIALAALLIFGLTVLFLYIGSVMRFILFDSVISGECRVRAGWVRRRAHGRQLFRFRFLVLLATFAIFIVVIGIPAGIAWSIGWFANPGQNILRLVLTGIVLFLVFIAIVIAQLLVEVFTKDFVVPQMALEEVTAMEGWRRFWPMLKAEKGGYAGYIGMKIVLNIAAAVVLGIITIVAILIIAVPIGIVAYVVITASANSGLTWTAATISLAVIAGCIALAFLVFVAALISVPAIVFFPTYSIYFFAARYPTLSNFLWPPQPAHTP
jgi:hypothetical protein